MQRIALSASFLSFLAASGVAQNTLRFPLDPQGPAPALEGLLYRHDAARTTALASQSAVRLSGVSLPDGRTVELELTRIRPERMGFRYYVDGLERTDLLTGADLSIWKGRVAGEPGSDALLSFSQVGAQGWIDSGAERIHLSPRPDAAGNWWNGDVLMVTEGTLNAAGMAIDSICQTERPVREAVELPSTPGAGGSAPLLGPGCSLRECKLAVETDYQYYQRFNDTSAQAVYTTTLWAFISDRYETQAATILTFPYVGFYSTPADPWTTPDAPGTSSAMLTEFRNAWVGNVPNGARLGHFMSGASLGGGVAWLDVLCSNSNNFAVSGNINGTISFPIVQQPNNWDFMVCAHELGHNFDALHTHDYCPPLDQCPPSQYFGQCQTQQVCTNQGTIMSYCHLCPGSTGNITTFFHTTSAQFMTAAAQACLPMYSGLSGDAPTLLAQATPTPVEATAAGTVVGSVNLYWRANPSASFTPIAMTNVAGGLYQASLPAFGCADSPQYYYAFTEQTCGLLTFPAGAPGAVLSAQVGSQQVTFSDNFESNLGWTPTNLGASSGDWQRGVPVNDPAWAYDPAADGDGSGSCWLTQNALGNTDVDNGAVQLLSPTLNLSAAGSGLEYRYFLNLTNTNGDDRLLVEISANGASGPWFEIARHTANLGLSWATHSISGATIAGAGATPGANMRVRFTANDGGTRSIVEAGLDGFKVTGLVCTGIGVSYCSSLPNSSGQAAVISTTGSASLAANNLALSAAPVPAVSIGLFFFSANAVQVPFGNGVRCVGSPSIRFGTTSAVAGTLDRAIDNTVYPANAHFAAGVTLNFQAWFRDAAAGGANFNLSDGYRITFTP